MENLLLLTLHTHRYILYYKHLAFSVKGNDSVGLSECVQLWLSQQQIHKWKYVGFQPKWKPQFFPLFWHFLRIQFGPRKKCHENLFFGIWVLSINHMHGNIPNNIWIIVHRFILYLCQSSAIAYNLISSIKQNETTYSLQNAWFQSVLEALHWWHR